MARKKKRTQPDSKELIRDHRAHREGKISDRISFLVSPLLQDLDASEINIASSIVAIACTAWHISLQKTTERQSMNDKFMGELALAENQVEDKAMIQEMLDEFLQRKLKYFPNDKRFITGFKVIPNSSGFQLSIASVYTENQPQ